MQESSIGLKFNKIKIANHLHSSKIEKHKMEENKMTKMNLLQILQSVAERLLKVELKPRFQRFTYYINPLYRFEIEVCNLKGKIEFHRRQSST